MTGDGKCDCCIDNPYCFVASFSDIFEQHIPAQAESDKDNGPITSVSMNMPENKIEVIRSAHVVRAGLPVGATAASPEINAKALPAVLEKLLEDASDIGSVGTSFQAVEGNEQAVGSRLPTPIQVEKVAVGCLQCFPLVVRRGNFPKQGGIYRVEMGLTK